MSHVQTFKQSAKERLRKFLQTGAEDERNSIVPLTPDASTREYFRVKWKNASAIACVYPEKFEPEENSYLDATNLFRASNLPVAEIHAFDGAHGVIILEDFGDKILRDFLAQAEAEERENLINESIRLIAKIQAATEKAFELNSVASHLAFDAEKLGWELNFFKTHYFESYRQEPLTVFDENALRAEFEEISEELEGHVKVLCHRDFHAANLMIDGTDKLRIIDHQDARMGAVSYDLVSLLLDRVVEPPGTVWIREKRLYFLAAREELGLETIDPDEFAREFRLQTIQRCLKAIGTFSFQTAVRSRDGYAQYIEPMFRIVFQAAERLERFPHLQRIIKERINE